MGFGDSFGRGDVVGRAVVEVGIDDQTGQALKQVQTNVGRAAIGVENQFSDVLKGIGRLGAAGVAVGLKASATTKEWAGQVRQLQRELGLTAGEASRLVFVAQQTGVEVQALSSGFGILFKHLVNNDAVTQRYGLTLKGVNGQNKDAQQILEDVSDVISGLPPGVERTAAALELLGRGGKELLPILSKGSDEIRELASEARKYGLELTPKNIEQIKRQKEAQRDLTAATKGYEVQLGLKVIPAQTALYEVGTKVLGLLNKTPGAVVATTLAVGGLAKVLGEAGTLLKGVADGLGVMNAGFGRFRGARAGAGVAGGAAAAASVAGGLIWDGSVGRYRDARGRFVPGIAPPLGFVGRMGYRAFQSGFVPKTFAGLTGAAAAGAGIGMWGIDTYRATTSDKESNRFRFEQERLALFELRNRALRGETLSDKDRTTLRIGEGMARAENVPGVGEKLKGDIQKYLDSINSTLEQGMAKLATKVGRGATLFATAFGGMTKNQLDEWRTNTIKNFSSVEGAIGRLSGKSTVTAKEVVTAFGRQARDLDKFKKDWDRAVGRLGIGGSDLSKYLAERGLEAGPIVAAISKATDAQIKQMVADIQKSKNIAETIPQALLNVPGMATFPKGDPNNPLFVVVTNPDKRIPGSPATFTGPSANSRHQRGGTGEGAPSGRTQPAGRGKPVNKKPVMHGGGRVVGMHRRADVPIVAQEGEWVTDAETAERWQPLLRALPRMHHGGRVGRHASDDSFAGNDRADPNRGRRGFVQAEDGSWVRHSFYSHPVGRGGPKPRGTVRAEDGSLVPLSFYSPRAQRAVTGPGGRVVLNVSVDARGAVFAGDSDIDRFVARLTPKMVAEIRRMQIDNAARLTGEVPY